MLKLAELEPRWVSDGSQRGMGISFDCPCCKQIRLAVFFANPLHGSSSFQGPKLWQRTGETFETLTLSPSIDASQSGHWHGFITNGEIR